MSSNGDDDDNDDNDQDDSNGDYIPVIPIIIVVIIKHNVDDIQRERSSALRWVNKRYVRVRFVPDVDDG